MDKLSYGKWGGWIATVVVLLRLFTAITAQPGFLSISCGGKTNATAENNITWVTDAHYIDVGESADIGDASEQASGSLLHTMRYFPKPLNKSCYQLPVAPDVPHLLRLWFATGNFSGYAGFSYEFAFSIETVDMLASRNVTVQQNVTRYYEHILVTKGRVLYICLVRTWNDDPFISAIEIRRLQHGMYTDAQPGTILFAIDMRMLQDDMNRDAPPGSILFASGRYDVGGNSTVRYPHDKFDRIWTPLDGIDSNFYYARYLQNISSKNPISTTIAENHPPAAVLQTACVVNSSDSFPLQNSIPSLQQNGEQTLLFLYFAEIEPLNMSKARSFSVVIDGESLQENITLVGNYSAQEVRIQSNSSPNFFKLLEGHDSTLPIINAYEYYEVVPSDVATLQDDFDALNAIKRRFDIKDWISPDPCYLVPWHGIGCGRSFDGVTIFEIDLAGRNLTGSVPIDIQQLNTLMNLSLHHNQLTGPMPNLTNFRGMEGLYLQYNNLNGTLEWLSGLTLIRELSLDHNQFTGPMPNASLFYLERLYLQNNNLNGTLEWLSGLTLLQELNIANNDFSGEIPERLLVNCSLKLNYSGNPYLRMTKRKCFPHHSNSQPNNSRRSKLKVVLGITLSGIIALALTAGIVAQRKKLWRNGAIGRSGVEKETNPFLNQEYSMIVVPNPTNSRAFTLHEINVATKNFSEEIGRGGFGSVFFGELPDGKAIAVKVLSMFSRQGIHEFLNEVGLLSKINHRNLVSLLGYCNETKGVMLIYEHMSGGSLRDHLHGPRAENSDLNWKRRLKIALHAAQGLEYLHVGCNPKIIHRDVKTANILLDSNLNGKLADFGLSKMTIDGEATHVTTVVKGTFGYLDPEYFNTQMLTEKSDVYSFGVVLLEILSGRAPIDTNLPEEELNIVRWVTPYLLETDENGGRIIDVIDKRLCGGYDMKSASNVAKIAMRCVQALPSRRPTVSEVVAELKEAINVEEDKDCISIAEENGIQNGDVSSGEANSSKREGMEWTDNSCNMPNEGR